VNGNGDHSGTPRIIQGGMGVAISGWPLASAVARTGQLGVVSGTALKVVCARRLQEGDPGGHVRRALANFPLAGAAERILRTYYVAGGKAPQAAYRLGALTVRSGYALVRAVHAKLSPVTVSGGVLAAHLWRPWAERISGWIQIAVDDGRHDRIRPWLVRADRAATAWAGDHLRRRGQRFTRYVLSLDLTRPSGLRSPHAA
jgi:hypothetical protein